MNTQGAGHALIVGGGSAIHCDRLTALALDCDWIVAADSGLEQLLDAGIAVTAAIGDFDSVSPRILARLPRKARLHNPSQDETDMEKALRHVAHLGATHADCVSVTGDRLDHTLNAISLVLRYRNRITIRLHDHNGWATLAEEPPLIIEEPAGTKVSLIPAPAVCGLNSDGLEYPLENLDLAVGTRDAISNTILTTPARVRWISGAFLLYRQI